MLIHLWAFVHVDGFSRSSKAQSAVLKEGGPESIPPFLDQQIKRGHLKVICSGKILSRLPYQACAYDFTILIHLLWEFLHQKLACGLDCEILCMSISIAYLTPLMYGVNAQQKSCIFTAEKSAACGPTLTQAAPVKKNLFFSPPDMAPLHDLCVMINLILILEEKTIPLF